jgi:membrane protease YdiL (CAAX protease family)
MTLPPPTTAPAGWYPDPQGAGYRYFDGRVWAAVAPTFREREPHPELPGRVAVGALVILTVSLIVAKTLVELLVPLEWPVLVYIVILSVIGYGPSVWWAWYVRQRWGQQRFASMGWTFRWSDLGWGPLVYISTIVIQAAIVMLVFLTRIPFSSNLESARDIGADRSYVVATVIAAVVAAPLVEELVFRGIVLRGFLSRIGPAPAVLAQGLLFGVAHVDPVRGVGNVGLAIVLSTVGIVFGTVAYLLRRLGPTIVAHAIFNGVAMLVVLSGWLDGVDSPFDSVIGAAFGPVIGRVIGRVTGHVIGLGV